MKGLIVGLGSLVFFQTSKMFRRTRTRVKLTIIAGGSVENEYRRFGAKFVSVLYILLALYPPKMLLFLLTFKQ